MTIAEYNRTYCFSEILTPQFLEPYMSLQPTWGFNGLGYIVYKRTYSRMINDSTTEEWWQTASRCINGAQKIGASYTKEEAERLFDLVFNLKCNFAGRMLWQLGTSTVDRFGGNSLLNCWYISMKEPKAFLFLFENLMLGGGVGFSVRREDIHELPRVKKDVIITNLDTKDADFIVPDSREGWIKLLSNVLDAYFHTGKSFTYSTILVRGSGEPIMGFGGVASGPQILKDGLFKISNIFKSREGKKLRSVDVMDICNIIGSIVVAGNIRRSAQICLGDPDDYLFIKAKNWSDNKVPNWRAMSNNTICADNFDQISNDVWSNGFIIDPKTGNAKGEPYGFFNLPLTQNYGRINDGMMKTSDIYPTDIDNAEGINPCFHGDTLIAVADGRNSVSIKTLTEEGRDVPVYSIDPSTGKVSIKWGRNPRLTGRNRNIVRVHLDDGSYLDVTPEHKFPLKTGEIKEAKSLICGDSLFRYTKVPEQIISTNPKEYYRIYCDAMTNGKNKIYEHRMITKFYNPDKWKETYSENQKNGWINGGLVIHHKNYDSLNNRIDNLEIMTFEDHSKLHASNDTQGEKNGRYSGVTNKDIEEFAIKITKQYCRRLSRQEWEKEISDTSIPINFTKFRRPGWFKNCRELLIWAANECGYEYVDLDPRIVKTYCRALQQGYNSKIEYGKVYVEKTCEYSGDLFWVDYQHREHSFSCIENANKYLNSCQLIREKRNSTKTVLYVNNANENKQNQCRVFSALKFKLGTIPSKKQWESQCKLEKIPFRLGSKHSFKGYKDLMRNAANYNHKVVMVENLSTTSDVYNITVDDNHTVGIITKTKTNKRGNVRYDGIFTFQCGEVGLASGECCNLAELYLNNITSKEELRDCATLLYKTQKAIASLNFIHDETTKMVHKNMRLGLGVTGICQSIDKLDWLEECYKELREFDKEWSKIKNVNESIKLTTIKPSGSLSILGGATAGIHPAYSKFFIRRIRMSSHDPLVVECKKMGYNVEFIINFDGTEDRNMVVISFPCKCENAIVANEMNVLDQLNLVVKLQSIWSDNAVSVTAYYKPEELDLIKDWMKSNYETKVKSVSFLLHSNHGFIQAPYEEIDESTYLKLIKKVKPLSQIMTGTFDLIEGIECEGGSCPIR